MQEFEGRYGKVDPDYLNVRMRKPCISWRNSNKTNYQIRDFQHNCFVEIGGKVEKALFMLGHGHIRLTVNWDSIKLGKR